MCIHPFISIKLLLDGSKLFFIAKNIKINKIRFLEVGDNVSIGAYSRFEFITSYFGEVYSPSLRIGNNSNIGQRFTILCAASIKIGKNTLIASDVLITSENHGMNPELSDSYDNIPLQAQSVTIGEGCWIGEKVCILPGVELGERCIVGAGAVVNKSFPSYSIIGGVPAKLIKRYNFANHQWEKV